VDQHARAGALVERVSGQTPRACGECHELAGGRRIDAAFVHHDGTFVRSVRVAEFERREALPGGRLQRLVQTVVAGVVGHDEAEIRVRVQQLTGCGQRQLAARIGQRMDEHRGVGTRLDHFVQIADRAEAHGACQRAVLPARAVVIQQEAADQVARAEVFMAGDGDQRPAERQAMYSTKRVLPQPVGPLSMTGRCRACAASKASTLVAAGRVVRLVGDTPVGQRVCSVRPPRVGRHG
jgi:hypothetical protein